MYVCSPFNSDWLRIKKKQLSNPYIVLSFSQESKGKGTCDGVFRKKRFFTCDQNCGIFAAIHKVRRDPDVPNRRQYSDRSIPIHNDSPLYQEEQKLIEESGLREKDRIVWISDNGPEFGEVKWIGILPDSNRRDITVGVEFVSLS